MPLSGHTNYVHSTTVVASIHPGILGYSTQMYTKNTVYAHAGKHKPAARIAVDLMYLLARVSPPSYEFSTAVAVLDTRLWVRVHRLHRMEDSEFIQYL